MLFGLFGGVADGLLALGNDLCHLELESALVATGAIAFLLDGRASPGDMVVPSAGNAVHIKPLLRRVDPAARPPRGRARRKGRVRRS